jgi:hypothetical protein
VADLFNIIPALPSGITKEDIIESYNIEKSVFSSEFVALPEMVQSWFEHNDKTILGSRDKNTGKLIGFFNTLPVTDELFDTISKGDFDDTIVNLRDIRKYDKPGLYKLYFSSICVHPKYNTTIAFKVMFDYFIEMMMELARDNDIFISDIIAHGITTKGRFLCESIGMQKHCNSIHNTPIYTARLMPPDETTLKPRNRHIKRLISYYYASWPYNKPV